MKTLHDPISLGGIATQNRIVRSATFEFSHHAKGDYNPEYARIYETLAKGGVGIIITGMVAVDANSPINAQMIRAYDDQFVPGLRQIVEQVHASKSRLVVQISHCGVHAGHIESGGPRLGASAMQTTSGATVQAMTAEDIAGVAAHFAGTAARCREAGADGVQLHAAHGYLLSQFLSPYYNRRDDAYGGDIAGRSRIVMEVYDAIRERVGPDYPVWIKINNSDRTTPGLTQEECLWVCQALENRGIHAIEISGGLSVTPESSAVPMIKTPEEETPYASAALSIAEKISVPVISVCGYRTPKSIHEWLNRGKLEAIALSRPLIVEPDLPNRWKDGDTSRAICISCNQCFRPKESFGCQNPAFAGRTQRR
ncbi:NADH:flavin oxidoreductase [Oxalobacter vibrioformis]|uniref:NADH:flavin oxidoreductase n=1 Tax=Oxalobacter vibrioformis TaxID=933080 RepID=A0A9E9LYW2_9BURK|nr:NADH:flavin oxidoreductase [Oxalobacter vibrioformis]WAW10102.1 NADH:flavin oxidoreductase [Oxalobacter vibrioformis]